MIRSIAATVLLVLILVWWLTTHSSLTEALTEASEKIITKEISEVGYSEELIDKINELPDSLIAVQFEIVSNGDDEIDLKLHWNALDDVQDVGFIPVKAIMTSGQWYFEYRNE